LVAYKCWFDTALSGDTIHLAALTKFADPSRILFGTDFPYAPDAAIKINLAGQEQLPMEPKQRTAIMYEDATALFAPSPSV